MSSRIVLSSHGRCSRLRRIGLVAARQPTPSQPVLGTRTVKVLEVGGLKFKDLNKNGNSTRTRTGASRWTRGSTTSCRR